MLPTSSSLLDAHPEGLFVKPRGGSHGEGAFPIPPEPEGWRFPGGVGTSRDVFDYCVSCAQTDTSPLVQPRLITTEALRCVMAPTGFGTIRAVTYMHDQRPALIAACLRIVVEGNAADNFSHGTSGNLVAPIDKVTRTLITAEQRHGPKRGRTSSIWTFIRSQAFVWSDFKFRHRSELLKLVLRAQVAFGGLCTVGWDVGIT